MMVERCGQGVLEAACGLDRVTGWTEGQCIRMCTQKEPMIFVVDFAAADLDVFCAAGCCLMARQMRWETKWLVALRR
jgi:hypothetical protein